MKVPAKETSAIIDALGGTSAVARAFGIRSPSVSCWRRRGLPLARLQTLALLFPEKISSLGEEASAESARLLKLLASKEARK